eukprot:6210483-Pleurochrysis_carterae.AAC.1
MTVSTNTDSQRSGSGRRRGGSGAPGRWLNQGALSGQGRPSRAGFRELGIRSASAPQVCMRRESKTANSACECQIVIRRPHASVGLCTINEFYISSIY